MNATNPRPTDDGDDRALPLHFAVTDLLHEVAKLAGYVTDLSNTHQRGLGFLTYQGRLTQDRLLREERKARIDLTPWGVGLAFMRGTPGTLGTGQVRAAGNVSAIAADAELTATLQHLTRRLVKTVEGEGVCSLSRLPQDPSLLERLAHLNELQWLTHNTRILGEVERDLVATTEAMGVVIDGPLQEQHPDPCPYCGRHTLIVYYHDDVIRCVPEPGAAACRCDVDSCPCKYDRGHRHEWHRHRNGWYTLAAQIQAIKDTAAADEEAAELLADRIPETPAPEKTVRPRKAWDDVDGARSIDDTPLDADDHEALGCLTWMRYSPTQILYGCTHPTGHNDETEQEPDHTPEDS